MKRDPEVARQIQRKLLPASALRFGPWEVVGRLAGPGEVCADLFDYYLLDGGRHAIVIARLLDWRMLTARAMHGFRALLRAHCNGSSTIADAIMRLNEDVCRTKRSGSHTTVLFYAEFDWLRGVLRYSNCGYSIPLLRRRDGTVVDLSDGLNLLVGLWEDVHYTEAELSIEPGESLLLYSDGVRQSLDPMQVGRELERLRTILQRCEASTPGDMITSVLTELQAFRDRAQVGEVERFPGIANPNLVEDLKPFRMEAHRMREHADRNEDMALVVLGPREPNSLATST